MHDELLLLDKNWLGFEDVISYLQHQQQIAVTETATQSILKCRDYLDKKLNIPGNYYYGINTGFGFLHNVKISSEQAEQLQANLLMSHACGMGDETPKHIVRLMMMLKIKSLSYGYSGVQLDTVQRLVDMHNSHVLPVIFTQGSLGASGDLAPLSHLSLPLIGMGRVNKMTDDSKWMTAEAATVLQQHNWQPVKLKSKEGLALINGTQFMSAYGMWCLHKAKHLIQMADIITAMSYDAFDCITEPLTECIHIIRPHKGQLATARTIRNYLKGSEIIVQKKEQVQDPYSFRCVPQVHGATKDVFENVLSVFLTEINSVTDNPNIFPEDDLVVSGGNFHGQTLALHLDFLSIAMSELANISERRIYQLISGQRNLPLFLIKDAGLNNGFMIPQYTAAGIVSENKQLCTPASVDSISSSNNQEDHVSMGANAATKCLRVVDNVEKVLAIELLSAAQALDFRRPLKSSDAVEALHISFRRTIAFNDADRILHDDMMKAVEFIRDYTFAENEANV